MSLTPRLTLIGLFKYSSDLFKNLNLPPLVNEETFIDTLLMTYGECPLVNPSYDYMVLAIGAWSNKWYSNIERMVTALTAEYNPIHNYDRTEIWTENEKRNLAKNVNGTSTKSSSVSNSNEENREGNTEYLVSAYNESEYQPSEKTDTNLDVTNEFEQSASENGTETQAETHDENTANSKNGHAFGNIGTTQTTEMIKNEIQLRRDNNIYTILSELFYHDFCMYVF